MIYALNNRYGLDQKIYRIQQYLDSKLDCEYKIYGQLYEQQKDKGIVLEYDEKEPLIDDREKLIIGFRVINKVINNFTGNANIDCIITTETDNREYTELLFYKLLTNCGFINSIDQQIKIGITNVFNGLYQEDLKYRDIIPKHVFAYTININYSFGELKQNDQCI